MLQGTMSKVLETLKFPHGSVEIILGTEADRARIIAFLRSEFFSTEPLNAAFGTTQGPEDARYIRALDALRDGAALLATDVNSGELLGLSLCSMTSLNPEVSGREEDISTAGPAGVYSGVLAVLRVAEEEIRAAKDAIVASGVVRAHRASPTFDVLILAVGQRARRRGIASLLLARAAEEAYSRGCGTLSMLCTGSFSAALAQQFGMRLVYSKPYASFVERHIMPRIPPPPHSHITLYTLDIVREAAVKWARVRATL